MKIKISNNNFKTFKSDAIIFFIAEKNLSQQIQFLPKELQKTCDGIFTLEKFSAKKFETITIFQNEIPTPRIIFIGCGEKEKISLEIIRQLAATFSNHSKSHKTKTISLDFSSIQKIATSISPNEIAHSLTEGIILSQYKYEKYISKKEENKIDSVTFLLEQKDTSIEKSIQTSEIICSGTILARDLENAPSNEIYPETLSQVAKKIAKENNFKCTVWDKKKIAQQKFNGLLSVSNGSNKDARFIILEYNNAKNKNPIVLVGKGITFDSGGISIKPAQNMAEMKMDMSGAATVIGIFNSVAKLKLPVNIVGLIPAAENLPSGTALKPGDIITHFGGKTSEVDNTDAEGRLVLADALSYASKFNPNCVIDFATLTGACVVALGHYATGMMGNDNDLMAKLKLAGEKTYERVWELPMFEEYEKLIKSDVADVKNVGGRWGGAITAAMFLKKFIGNFKWIHFDIAGTAILEENFPYSPKGGSGVGVRLIVEFLRS